MKTGHNTGTEDAENRSGIGSPGRPQDRKSFALAFVPRLMSLEIAAHYTSLGVWSLRQLVWAGKLPVVRVPRPDGSGDMRRVLIDRNDLDQYIESLPREYEPN